MISVPQFDQVAASLTQFLIFLSFTPTNVQCKMVHIIYEKNHKFKQNVHMDYYERKGGTKRINNTVASIVNHENNNPNE